MGTSSAVMSGRQLGKSNIASIWVDEALATDNKLPKYIEFGCDPLALAVSMLDHGKNIGDVHTALSNHIQSGIIDPEHIDKALAIRKYYRNKLTMLILKNTQGKLSKFRLDLYDFLNNDSQKYDKALIPIIIKLPDFYAEDCAIDKLAKEYTSINSNVNKIDTNVEYKIDTNVEYVATIKRTTSRSKFSRYFFKTKNNYLIEVTVPNEQAAGPMDFIAKLGTVRLKGKVFTKKFHDKDFVYSTTNKHFEILPVGENNE